MTAWDADFTEEGRTLAFGFAEGMSRSPPTSTSSPTVPDPLRMQLQGILASALDTGSTHLTRDVIPTAETAAETATDHALQQAEAAAGRIVTQGTAQLREALAGGLQGGVTLSVESLRAELATTRRWATGLGVGLTVTAAALALYVVRTQRAAESVTRFRTTITRKPNAQGRLVTRATSTARTRRA